MLNNLCFHFGTRYCRRPDLVFFTNSGAEAAEGMIKAMRKYHAVNGAPEKVTLIGFDGAFHGRTLAALAAAGNQQYLDGFGPVPQGFVHCSELTLEAVEKLIDDSTAGIRCVGICSDALAGRFQAAGALDNRLGVRHDPACEAGSIRHRSS